MCADARRRSTLHPIPSDSSCFVTAEKGGVARAKGEGEKEKECTTEGKSRRRRDEKAPWALNYWSGEGGDVEKGRRRTGVKRAMLKQVCCHDILLVVGVVLGRTFSRPTG